MTQTLSPTDTAAPLDLRPPSFERWPRVDVERAAWTRAAEPVFLIGCPRSGTTWLQSLIASHPDVYTGVETQFFPAVHTMALEFWRGRDFLCGIGAYLEPGQFFGMAAEMFWKVVSTLPEPARPPRVFLEKSPHHALVGETILNTFPGARFIHLIRDPRTTVSSLLRVHRSWGRTWAPGNVRDAAVFWKSHVTAARLLRNTLGPEQFLELHYEECAAAPERALAAIWSWLGLTPEPETLDRAVRENALRGGEAAQPFPSVKLPAVEKNGDTVVFPEDFVGKAARSAAETDLTYDDVRLIEEEVGPLLFESGYLPAAPYEQPARAESPAPAKKPSLAVIIVGEGDDPTPVVRGLEAMLPDWQDDWELILVSHQGSACEALAGALEGDYRILPPVPGETYHAALFRAGAAARAGRALIPTDLGLFSLPVGVLMAGGGCRGGSRAHVWAWLNWRAERRPDLLPSCG